MGQFWQWWWWWEKCCGCVRELWGYFVWFFWHKLPFVRLKMIPQRRGYQNAAQLDSVLCRRMIRISEFVWSNRYTFTMIFDDTILICGSLMWHSAILARGKFRFIKDFDTIVCFTVWSDPASLKLLKMTDSDGQRRVTMNFPLSNIACLL